MRRLLIPSVLVLLLVAGGVAAGTAAQAPPGGEPVYTRSVRDGVYSAAQAARGQKTFESICIACHAARMWQDYWEKESLGDLFQTIRTNMPEDAPGSLRVEEYRDVLAYILQTNKLPAGVTDMPETLADLRQIRVERPAP